jgi:predicted phage baseplate assembly protein
VPFISTVVNHRAAVGGTDGESVADAAVRGPLQLRTRDRAVTAEDYERLAREAAPEVARVRCVEADGDVRVLVVPGVGRSDTRTLDDLSPGPDDLERIGRYLDERRCVGARVSVQPPVYVGVTVVAGVRAALRSAIASVQERAVRELYRYLDPVDGGPAGTGWPFGRALRLGELHALLERVPGVESVEDVRLFPVDPVTGERGSAASPIEVPPDALLHSVGHQVRVVGG